MMHSSSCCLERNDAAASLEFMERSRARVFQDRFFAAGVTPGSLTLPSLQKRLDGHTALIEFWTGPDAIAAVWLTRDSSGIARKNFSADEMDKFARMVDGLPENLGNDWRTGFRSWPRFCRMALFLFGVAAMSICLLCRMDF